MTTASDPVAREEVYLYFFILHMQSLKTYQLYHGEWQQAEAKMRHAENQKMKLERQQSSGTGVTAAKSALSRRFRNFEKLSEKVSRSGFAKERKGFLTSCKYMTLKS